MSVAEWGLALSFCPWDLNTVHPAIISLASALLACHRTVSFPFYSSYLRHKFLQSCGQIVINHTCTHKQKQRSRWYQLWKMYLCTQTVVCFFLWCLNLFTHQRKRHTTVWVHRCILACFRVNCTIWSCSWCSLGKGKRCLGYPLSPLADLGCAAHLDALQRDTDFPQVLCALPVSADVLDTLWCLTGCEMFLFQVLIHHRIPVPWALGCGTQLFNHSALRAVTQSKHRCETGRIFPSVSQSPPVQQSGAFGGISGWLCCSFSSVLE